ncbi:MAG: hypothetical protein IJF80_05675 [Clostridia bacterium]|nr:hypothetical protein [Clostridia bacterium]
MNKNYQTESKFTAKTAVLSFQHMFAMFGSCVLVPILCNMSIAMSLLAAGIGTILFYFLTKRKVPVFLASSFAFLPALQTCMANTVIGTPEWNIQMGKAMPAVFIAGLVYVVLALIIKFVGVAKIKKLFPPIVVGPVIIVIGMILAPKMFWNNIIGQAIWTGTPAWKEWTAAIVTAAAIILTNALAKPKSFLKVIPILIGFIVGYIYSLFIGLVDYSGCDWSQIVIFQDMKSLFGFYGELSIDWGIILSIVPLALVTFMEHLGDISANSNICGKDFMVDPGVHRTVLGDGVATSVAALLGAPANTTYGENTAVLAITKNYNPKNILYAAIFAVIFGCFSIFATAINTIPSAVIGGASIVLFGMISASGLRSLVDNKVNFSNTKNLIVVSVVLSIGLGLGAMSLAGDVTGDASLKIMVGTVEISPLAIATVVGIILNLIIPNRKGDDPETIE